VKFEHLVEVNDLSRPDLALVTREQLWRGLVLRAMRPELFVPHLTECRIVSRSATALRRILTYGEVAITDEVRLHEGDHVHYAIAAQGEVARSSLHVRIEEPVAGALLVRFVYEDDRVSRPGSEDELFDRFRRGAYEEADVHTVRVIRELVETRRLDALTRD
jgi:hypothetical protein